MYLKLLEKKSDSSEISENKIKKYFLSKVNCLTNNWKYVAFPDRLRFPTEPNKNSQSELN